MSGREDQRGAAGAPPPQTASSAHPSPSGWRRLFRRPRVLSEVRFALGAALVMAVAGTALAFAMPPIRLLPTDALAVRLFVQAAVGFGLGWWGGLFWAIALVFYARGFSPPPPLDVLMLATWLAGAVVAATAVAARAFGASVIISIGAGVVVGTTGARLFVSHAARKVPS